MRTGCQRKSCSTTAPKARRKRCSTGSNGPASLCGSSSLANRYRTLSSESFNGKFRDERLNQHWFRSLRHARQMIQTWRVHYNTERSHASIAYGTPFEFAAERARPTEHHEGSATAPARLPFPPENPSSQWPG
jgi:transposase InsO family protein